MESSSGECSIRVAVRIRPFIQTELKSGQGHRRVVSVHGNESLVIVNPKKYDADPDAIAEAAAIANFKEWAQVFRFNHSLWSFSSGNTHVDYADQEAVYRTIGSEIVNNALNGVSCSCFAYGASASGKSYTMFGTPERTGTDWGNDPEYLVEDFAGLSSIRYISEEMGLVPRVFSDIVEGLFRKDFCQDVKITLSFMEIYNEKIKDLLCDEANGISPPLKVREHPVLGPYVEGLTKAEVLSAPAAIQLVYKGYLKRAASRYHTSAALLPKSHVVVTLELMPVALDSSAPPHVPKSASKASTSSGASATVEPKFVRVQMVDLASSDKDGFAGSVLGDSHDGPIATPMIPRSRSGHPHTLPSAPGSAHPKQDDKMEARLVRRSLSTLGYIIKALGKHMPAKALPYRDSVLTWLLKDALTGRSHTVMLATISPSSLAYEESMCTLKYAERLCVGLQHGANHGNGALSDDGSSIGGLSSAFGDEHLRVQENLNATTPGSDAAKKLFQLTVADPQQRLAKLKASADIANTLGLANGGNAKVKSELDSAGHLAVGDASHSTLEGLRDAYRSLHGQLVELQIELENARTDRDSMALELRGTKEALELANTKLFSSQTLLGSPSLSYFDGPSKASDKTISELQDIIARKEEALDRVLADFSDEKRSRMNVEQAMRTQATEYYAKFEELQRTQQKVVAERDNFHRDLKLAQAEREEMRSRMQAAYQQVDDLNKRLQLDQSHSNQFKSQHQQLLDELTQLRLDKTRLESSLRDVTERLTHGVNQTSYDSEAMKALIEQQEWIIKMYAQQSEAGYKTLINRVAILERFETHPSSHEEEILRLQDVLHGLLSRQSSNVTKASGSSILASDVTDLKKLLGFLGPLRERVQLMKAWNRELQQERKEQEKVSQQIQEIQSQAPKISRSKVVHQMDHFRKSADASEARAEYWQEVAKKVGSNPVPAVPTIAPPGSFAGQQERLQFENERLREDLTQSVFETKAAKQKLKETEEHAQKEFASLWMAVEELNKIDAEKNLTLQQLTTERDQAMRERDAALTQVKELRQECKMLKAELKIIDEDLIAVAEAEAIPIASRNPRKVIQAIAASDPASDDKRHDPKLKTSTSSTSASSRSLAMNTSARTPNPAGKTSIISPISQQRGVAPAPTKAVEMSRNQNGDVDEEAMLEEQIEALSDFLKKDRQRVPSGDSGVKRTSSTSANPSERIHTPFGARVYS